MLLVLDATPLIYLSKINLWRHLGKLGYGLATTPHVIEELQLGETAFKEAVGINRLLAEGKLAVKKSLEEIPYIGGLSKADVSVIFLAKKLNAFAVVDDLEALAYGKAMGAKAVHTSVLVIEAVRKKALSPEKAVLCIDEMIACGWRCDVETYKNILTAIKRAGV